MVFLITKSVDLMLVKLKGILNYYKFKPKNILFDHIPKCAGSSIGLIIDENYPFWWIYALDGKNPQKSVQDFKYKKNKKNYRAIKGHLAGHLIKYINTADYVICAVLRDPIERIISHYYYAKRTRGHYLNSLINQYNLSLRDYVNLDFNITHELRNYYVYYFSGLDYNDIIKNPDYAITKALDNISKYDLVGFQDKIDIFIKKLIELTGIQVRKIPRVNVTKEKKEVSEEDLLAIQRANELDIYFYKKCRTLLMV